MWNKPFPLVQAVAVVGDDVASFVFVAAVAGDYVVVAAAAFERFHFLENYSIGFVDTLFL